MLNDFEELTEEQYLKCEYIFLKYLKKNIPESYTFSFIKVINKVNYLFVYDVRSKCDILLVRIIIKAFVYNLKENEIRFTLEDDKIFETIEKENSAIAYLQIDKLLNLKHLKIIKKM